MLGSPDFSAVKKSDTNHSQSQIQELKRLKQIISCQYNISDPLTYNIAPSRKKQHLF